MRASVRLRVLADGVGPLAIPRHAKRPEPAWHRRGRQERRNARAILYVLRARKTLSQHHGGGMAPPRKTHGEIIGNHKGNGASLLAGTSITARQDQVLSMPGDSLQPSPAGKLAPWHRDTTGGKGKGVGG